MMKTLRIMGMVSLLAVFVLSCNNDNSVDQGALDQQAYDNADAINGGQLYDKFWSTDGYTGPVDGSVNQADIEGYSNFYRCKQCHGWDQKANMGWYVNRAPNTSRPDVSGVALTASSSETIRALFDDIKHTGGAAVDPARTADGTNASLGGNEMPDFGKILTDAQIWDIVKFLRERALDTDQLYDLAVSGTYPTGTKTMTNLGKNGDAAAGDTFYASKCAGCHGADGSTIPLEGKTLGDFMRGGPHESQHKVMNGHPGSSMGSQTDAILDVQNLFKAVSDTTKYPN